MKAQIDTYKERKILVLMRLFPGSNFYILLMNKCLLNGFMTFDKMDADIWKATSELL